MLLLACLALLAISCTDKQCFFPVDPKLYIDTKLTDTSRTFIDTLQNVRSLYKADTIPNVKTGKRLAFPLNFLSDTTALVFGYRKSTRTDTLILSYNRETALGSPECGYVTFFKNLNVIKSTLPNLQIIRNNVDTSKATTLRITIK